MSNSSDCEEFKVQAIEKLKAECRYSARMGVLAPLLENLLNSALEGEMDRYLEGGERKKTLADPLADRIIGLYAIGNSTRDKRHPGGAVR